MGVKGLFQTILRHGWNSVTVDMRAEYLRHSVMIVDVSIFVHKYAYNVASLPLPDIEDHVTAQLRSLNKQMLSYDMVPVFVFDGDKPTPAKHPERKRRAAARQRRLCKISAMSRQPVVGSKSPQDNHNDEETNSDTEQTDACGEQAVDNTAQVTLADFEEWFLQMNRRPDNVVMPRFGRENYWRIQQSLVATGVTCVTAPDEGEKFCAWLAKWVLRETDLRPVVVSEDSDVLPFGGPYQLRNMGRTFWAPAHAGIGLAATARQKIPRSTSYLVDTQKALNQMELSLSQFVDFCILCGCDFVTETLPGLGPVRALAAIKKHKSIDHILTTRKNPDTSLFEYQTARDMFTSFPASVYANAQGMDEAADKIWSKVFNGD